MHREYTTELRMVNTQLIYSKNAHGTDHTYTQALTQALTSYKKYTSMHTIKYCYSFICRVPLYTLFTFSPPHCPPITRISVVDRTAAAV